MEVGAVANINLEPRQETVQAISPGISDLFKGKDLEELLIKADQLQRLASAVGSTDVFEFQAIYDVNKEEWTGQLYNRLLCTGPSLYGSY